MNELKKCFNYVLNVKCLIQVEEGTIFKKTLIIIIIITTTTTTSSEIA